MIDYFVLIGAVLGCACTNLFGAAYNRRNPAARGASALYNALYTFTAFACWAGYYAFDFSFEPGVLWYSLGFGVCYAIAQIGIIQALRLGSVSLTTLIVQLSLIATAIWGFLFWDEKPTLLTAVGLVLVVIALALCIFQRGEKKGVSLKWLFFAFLAFAGNAGCTIFQKQQVLHYDGAHNGMLMVFAMLLSFLVCLVMLLRERPEGAVAIAKRTGFFPVLSGVANMLVNVFVIFLATATLPGSVVYPSIAVGALGTTTLFSALVFKEKLTVQQWIGIGVGAAAVLLLSL